MSTRPAEGPSDSTTLPDAAWTPLDYLYFGRYCEPDLLERCLEGIRTGAQATAAILVAFRDRTLFHSLLLIAHKDPDRGAALQKQLLTKQFTEGRDPPVFSVFDPEQHSADWLRERLIRQPPFSDLRTLLSARVEVLSRSAPPPQSQAQVSPPAALHVLLVDPASSDEWLNVELLLDRLLAMINATAPVVVHGNLMAERDVEETLEDLDELWAQTSAERARSLTFSPSASLPPHVRTLPQEVLEAALSLTGSSVGNIYFDARDGSVLELIAQVRNDRPAPRIPFTQRESVVAWVYQRRRPMIINDLNDYLRLHPAGFTNVAAPDLRPYAELAVPIGQASTGSATRNIIGVINVEKVAPLDSGYYTYRDLTILRLLAARLSLWRAQALMSQFSRSLAALTRRHTLQPEERSSEGRDTFALEIPAEFLPARDVIDRTLHTIFDLTRSHSATLRLLSPDRRILTRFAAYPAERLQDEHARLLMWNHSSVNAWVAKTGRTCYLPNLKASGALDGYGGLQNPIVEARVGTRSELCMPIFVSGRLVGTLNLESPYRDGFGDSRDLVGAFVEQVGLALEHARRAQEQTVYSLSIATTANVHELLKHVDKLRELDESNDTLQSIADSIQHAIDAGAEAGQVDSPSVPFPELVGEVARDLNVTPMLSMLNEPPVTVTHNGTHVMILRIVTEELLRNAYAASFSHDLRFTGLWRRSKLGGREYLTLRLANPIRRAPPPEVLASLFRRPIMQRSGRIHIGAFTAAALVRSLGGDIYIYRSEPPQFIVGLDLPIAAELTGGEASAWEEAMA